MLTFLAECLLTPEPPKANLELTNESIQILSTLPEWEVAMNA